MVRNKSIVFTGSFTYPTGYAATKRIQHIINFVQKKNYRAFVLLTNNKDNPRSGINLDTPFYALYFEKLPQIILILFYPFALIRGYALLDKIRKETRSNILYVYSGITIENFLFIKIAKYLGFRIIIDFVEDYKMHQEEVSFVRDIKIRSMSYFEKKVSKYADGLIVISSYLRVKFEQLVKPNFPIHLYPVIAEINNNIKEKSYNDQIKILYSGTYGNKDGIPFLITAISKLLLVKKNVLLILTGKLKRSIRELLLVKNIPFVETGYLSDENLYKEMKNADILVMPRIDSKYANAGFPFKLGEYLATGNPVVATNVGDLEKYLTNNINAIIVEPNSSEAIFNACNFLIDNPTDAERIGAEGLNACIQYFNPSTEGNLLYNFIEQLK